jgi:hypothetical protein
VAAALGAPERLRTASAQEASPLGWTEQPATLAGADVIAVGLGAAHDDDGPLAAARLAARRRGQTRAVALIQRWADDALAAVESGPRQAQAVHDAISARATLSRVRARADGSALVEVRCPLSALRAAFDHPRVPWH